MTPCRQIRADFDRDTIVVYQTYSPSIGKRAVTRGKFVSPFSFDRMTWIKPSFLWMMERCNWGRKANQECVLAVRITRHGWEEALTLAVLTHPDESVYADVDDWHRKSSEALVQVQWDPERSIRGGKLEYRAIQVGLSRHIVRRYVDDWDRGHRRCHASCPQDGVDDREWRRRQGEGAITEGASLSPPPRHRATDRRVVIPYACQVISNHLFHPLPLRRNDPSTNARSGDRHANCRSKNGE